MNRMVVGPEGPAYSPHDEWLEESEFLDEE